MHLTHPKSQHGFTLTELAMVLFIIALIAGSGLMTMSGQRDLEQRHVAEVALSTIREALVGFAMQNGRLPCPADATLASGTLGSGLEATTGSGSSLACTGATDPVTGVLPWATLGLPETDPWGRRYTYQVTRVYARGTGNSVNYECTPAATPAQTAFALCSPGKTKVYQLITDYGTVEGVKLTTDNEVPALVLSHGPNGFGAWLPTGGQAGAGNADEQINGNTDEKFVSHAGLDDMVLWISRPVLMNRMITAGKLP